MSGHTYTHTYTQDNYSNPRCACAQRVNNDDDDFATQHTCLCSTASPPLVSPPSRSSMEGSGSSSLPLTGGT